MTLITVLMKLIDHKSSINYCAYDEAIRNVLQAKLFEAKLIC